MQNQIINKVINYLAGEIKPEDAQTVLDWKKQHPDEFDKIQEIYQGGFFDQKDFQTSDSWKAILNKINENKNQLIKGNPSRTWLKIAAVFIGIISIGAAAFFYTQNTQLHQFANNSNKTMEVLLPDGSIITLDKYAEITYESNWLNQFNRKVELSGRAYFEITKDPQHTFLVNASQARIRVLGTKFTVSDKFDRIQVILNEGRVEVSSQWSDKTYLLSEHGQQLIINSNGFEKQDVVNKNLYFSWMEEKLQLNNCTVDEAIEYLNDSYDIKIQFADDESMNKQLYGSAPSDNPDLIIKAIALITGKKMIHENKIYKFE
jgi:ferric-dicitrate binding protein FerR (iron transport regulator)